MSTPDAENASPSPEHSGDEDGEDMAEETLLKSEPEDETSQSQSVNGTKPKDPKDPNRQKRKKARRACLACQRAHLTCSDERPCGRCIRRGLQDACQDGVRKKAKYLHDAPNEALIPPFGGSYARHLNGQNGPTMPSGGDQMSQQAHYFAQPQSAAYSLYSNSNQGMPPPVDTTGLGQYSGQSTPISPPYTQHPSQRTPPIPGISQTLQQTPQPSPAQMQSFGNLFDQNDPSLFNFDLQSLNFGNHYGALEFGMLGHMSSGAGETPPHETNIISPLNQAMYHANNRTGNFSESPANVGGYDGMDWQIAHSRQNSTANLHTPQAAPMTGNIDAKLHQDPFHNAYSVGHGAGSISSASPGSTGQEGTPTTFDGNPVSPAFFVNTNQQQAHHQQIYQNRPQIQRTPSQGQTQNVTPRPPISHVNGPRRMRRDTNVIYRDLKEPYQYTQAFHRFQELVRIRFPPEKRMRVAKAMASIRPSFINCTKDLDEQDLLAQERTFQRKLWGYEDWLQQIGTPSLVIRRSGEVALINKEFTLLTGWDRSVLLGEEPNLNTNWDSSSSQSQYAASSRGSAAGNITPDEALPIRTGHPVMIAELLDHDSVVRFYEDFARLAFGDARGTAARRVKLMNYIPRPEEDLAGGVSNGMSGKSKNIKSDGDHNDGTVSTSGVGQDKVRPIRRSHVGKDRIECQMCWCVWHDQFDMPAMIILNFLPIIQHSSPQESYRQPVQLAPTIATR